jgi:hypothetical protein
MSDSDNGRSPERDYDALAHRDDQRIVDDPRELAITLEMREGRRGFGELAKSFND